MRVFSAIVSSACRDRVVWSKGSASPLRPRAHRRLVPLQRLMSQRIDLTACDAAPLVDTGVDGQYQVTAVIKATYR